MNAEEIANFIMNGGTNATGQGRKELQKTGVDFINEYARQKCKEQRALCAKPVYDFIDNGHEFIYSSDILNAPEPPMNDIKPPVNKPE